jgi:hypothetical protein
MTDPYQPPRPRDDALQEELDALREQERQGHSTPKERHRAEQLERRLRVDERGGHEHSGDRTEQDLDEPAEEFHRDRREHGGMPEHPDDDRLARLTEEERVAAGIDDYDPDEVPPATDVPPQWDVTQTEEYQEERAEIRREVDKDELPVEGERDRLPPTHYDR